MDARTQAVIETLTRQREAASTAFALQAGELAEVGVQLRATHTRIEELSRERDKLQKANEDMTCMLEAAEQRCLDLAVAKHQVDDDPTSPVALFESGAGTGHE